MNLHEWKEKLISEIISPETFIKISIGIIIAIVSNYLWNIVSYQSTPIDIKIKCIGSIFNISIPIQYRNNLSITYNDKEIENAYITNCRFENKSGNAITPDKFETPITINTSYHDIISVFVTECSSSYLETAINKGIKINNHEVILPHITLNPKDSFKIIVITDEEFIFDPEISYRIVGYPEYHNDRTLLSDSHYFRDRVLVIILILIIVFTSWSYYLSEIKERRSAVQYLKEYYFIVVPKKQYKNAQNIKNILESFKSEISQSSVSDEIKESIIKERIQNVINDFGLSIEAPDCVS